MKVPLALQLTANLLSLVVALALGWPAGLILLLYWAENVVVAFWQVPRILLAGGAKGGLVAGLLLHALKRKGRLPPAAAQAAVEELARRLPRVSNLFVAAFFLLHYGLFTFVHGVFVFQLFLHQEMTPQTLAANLGSGGMALAVLGLMISHGVAFFDDLRSGRLAAAEPGKVMGEPYRRIVVLHLVVLGSGFALSLLPQPQVGVVLLAVVKTAMDLGLWRKQLPATEPEHVARIP